MMRTIATLALVAVFSFPLVPVSAGASETTKAKVSQVVHALGYDEVFRIFGPAIALGVTAAEERPEVARQLREAAEQSFEPESTVTRIVAQTDAALAPEETQAAFDFYENSPFGRKVAALERSVVLDGLEAGPTGADTRRIEDEQQALEALQAAEAAAPERFALYRRSIAAIDAEPRLNEFGNAIIAATLTGAVAGNPEMAGMLDVMIDNAVEGARVIAEQSYEQLLLLHAHNSFATLEIGELERLAEMLETPKLAAFYKAMNEAMTKVVSEDSQRFGERLGVILRANPG